MLAPTLADLTQIQDRLRHLNGLRSPDTKTCSHVLLGMEIRIAGFYYDIIASLLPSFLHIHVGFGLEYRHNTLHRFYSAKLSKTLRFPLGYCGEI